jgi:hypothetical protein
LIIGHTSIIIFFQFCSCNILDAGESTLFVFIYAQLHLYGSIKSVTFHNLDQLTTFIFLFVDNAGMNKAAAGSTSLNTKKLDDETENLARALTFHSSSF